MAWEHNAPPPVFMARSAKNDLSSLGPFRLVLPLARGLGKLGR